LPWLKLSPNGLAFTDGYTLLLATSANASNTTLYEKLSFNFIHDITPVASIAHVPLVMEVHPSVPAKTVRDFYRLRHAHLSEHWPGSMTGLGHDRQNLS